MSNRLGGKQGTAYLGTNANQPPNMTFAHKAPTQFDDKNVVLGDFWLDLSATPLPNLWTLVSLEGNVNSAGQLAHWVQITGAGGSGEVKSFTTDDGAVVLPDVSGNVDLHGSHNITTAGMANVVDISLTNTITLGDLTSAALTPAIDIESGDILFNDPFGQQADTSAQRIRWNMGGGNESNISMYNGNIFMGIEAGNLTLNDASAFNNINIGAFGGNGLTDGSANTTVGAFAGGAISTGVENSGLGAFNFTALSTGSRNNALGFEALNNLTTGEDNIAVGYQAGSFYTTEDSNICIGNEGTAADANTIRIGTQGTGSGQQDTCFIAGIAGVTTANTEVVTIDTVTGQLGSSSTASGNITINGNTGSVVGTVFNFQGTSLLSGQSVTFDATSSPNIRLRLTSTGNNTFLGSSSGSSIQVTGSENIAVGNMAFTSLTTGANNVALGSRCADLMQTGTNNTFVGRSCAHFMTSGNANTIVGYLGGNNGTTGLVSGSSNILIGATAGGSFTTNESNNIIIGNSGVIGDSLTTKIGSTQTSCYMAGIANVATTNSQLVTINTSTGQLGSVPMSDSASFVGQGAASSSISAITYFSLLGGISGGTAAAVEIPMPFDATLSNLYVNIRSNASTTNDTITLLVNGVATAITVTATALTTGVISDTSNSVSVSAGGLVSFEVSQSATGIMTMGITLQVN